MLIDIHRLTQVFWAGFFFCIFTAPGAFSAEKVTTHQVNGYDVYLVDLQVGNSFGLSYVVPYGSSDDEPQFFGRAHFFEHMMGHGSFKYPGQEAMRKKMSSIGYENNAATGLDTTFYFYFGHEQHALNALDYGLAPLGGLELEPRAFANEKKTVINEVIDTAPKNPEQAIFTLPFVVGLPQGHALKGHHVGTLETLGAMTSLDLHALHSKIYRPGILKVAVFANFSTGKWKREDILNELARQLPKNFGRKENPPERPSAPLFGVHHGPQVLEIEGSNDPIGALYFSLPEDVNREHVEVFLSAFSTSARGGVVNYFKTEKKWLTDLGTWVSRVGSQQIAAIFFDFTAEGYQNRDRVVQEIYSAIKRYRAEPLTESMLAKIRDRFKTQSLNSGRQLGHLIQNYPNWLTIPHEKDLVMLDWDKSIQHITAANVIAGAKVLDLEKSFVAFQGSAPLTPDGRDPVLQLHYQRRPLAASAAFPVSLPTSPSQVVPAEVALIPHTPQGQKLKNRFWRKNEQESVALDSLPHWHNRTIQVEWEFDRLTALEELSLQAWTDSFLKKYQPEFEELKSQGIEIGFYSGVGRMTINVQSEETLQVAALEWVVKKLKSLEPTEADLTSFKEEKQKSLRNRELGMPANVAIGLSSTLLSPRGLSAPHFEAALPQLTLEVVKSAIHSPIFSAAYKKIFFAGSFFESELQATVLASHLLAPHNIKLDPIVGDRLAVQNEKWTFFEPWTFTSNEGIGTTRIYKAPTTSRLKEYAAFQVLKQILNDQIFAANRQFGYVHGAGISTSSTADQHLMFYGQANHDLDLAKLHLGWQKSVDAWNHDSITDKEIEAAQNGLLASWTELAESSVDGAGMMSNNMLNYSHPFYNQIIAQIMKDLTTAEIRHIARVSLAPERGSLTVIKGSARVLDCENLLTTREEMRQQLYIKPSATKPADSTRPESTE